jgi:hypothetical protein
MIDCESIQDRMPDVAHGRAAWTETERAHLAHCADCVLEWRIVRAGMLLHEDTGIVAERVARSVSGRLREPDGSGRIIGRLPWRGAAIGLIAAAASVLLIVGVVHRDRSRPGVAGDTVVAVAMLPELQGLDESQLESVLRSLGPTAGDATPGVLPHLEDLTDSELEQLLRSEGGE